MTVHHRRRRFLWPVMALPVLAALPVLSLVRGGVWLHVHQGWTAWAALAGGAAAAAAVLTGYATIAWWRLAGRVAPAALAKWIVLPAVLLFCGCAAVTIAPGHAKSAAVRDTYRQLHPLLRMAVSVWVLADRGAVVTDMARAPEDYARMGLTTPRASRHYRQPDGWVHALDLRTRGRGALRNGIARAGFRLMGFRTLRHEGTADHLHVALPGT